MGARLFRGRGTLSIGTNGTRPQPPPSPPLPVRGSAAPTTGGTVLCRYNTASSSSSSPPSRSINLERVIMCRELTFFFSFSLSLWPPLVFHAVVVVFDRTPLCVSQQTYARLSHSVDHQQIGFPDGKRVSPQMPFRHSCLSGFSPVVWSSPTVYEIGTFFPCGYSPPASHAISPRPLRYSFWSANSIVTNKSSNW